MAVQRGRTGVGRSRGRQDGLTWTFHLRRDVSWHDGEPFTAHDVAFTFNRIIYNPEINASARATFTFRFLDPETGAWVEDRMSVRALDDDTVECVLPAPFAPFLRAMGTAIFPRHILEPYVDAGTFSEVWGIDTDPAEIIGTGPVHHRRPSSPASAWCSSATPTTG